MELSPQKTMLRRGVVALFAASTVLPLLGACYGLAPMQPLAAIMLPLAVLVVVGALMLARRDGDSDLSERLRRGLWGGLAGVAGYDWIRVPFHEGGMNPFAAIRSYGMWLSGAEQSSLMTDVTGLLYHTLNGVGFGITYAAIAPRGRQAALAGAVVWGVALEAFAVFSPFAEVYHLQGLSAAVVLAFFAHLFYGWPLGGVVIARSLSLKVKAGTLLALVSALAWLLAAFHDSNGWERVPPGTVEITTHHVQPGWTRVAAGAPLVLHNRTAETRTLRLPSDPKQKVEVAADGRVPLSFDRPGIYQILIEKEGLRSAFVIVEQGGLVRVP